MVSYLLDTNHATKLMAGEESITLRVRQAQARGDDFALSVTVLAELYYGVFLSQRQSQNRDFLDALVATLSVLPFDEAAAEMYGRIQAEQRAAGRPIRPLDVQIAAVARIRNFVVLTADRHFQFVTGITVENWLA